MNILLTELRPSLVSFYSHRVTSYVMALFEISSIAWKKASLKREFQETMGAENQVAWWSHPQNCSCSTYWLSMRLPNQYMIFYSQYTCLFLRRWCDSGPLRNNCTWLGVLARTWWAHHQDRREGTLTVQLHIIRLLSTPRCTSGSHRVWTEHSSL